MHLLTDSEIRTLISYCPTVSNASQTAVHQVNRREIVDGEQITTLFQLLSSCICFDVLQAAALCSHPV